MNPKDSVQALGLKDGALVMLHVKNAPLVKGDAPLPCHSFSSEGYGFFINLVNQQGTPLFRPKIAHNDTTDKLVKIVSARLDAKGLKLKVQSSRERLKPGKKISDYLLAQNDTVVVLGLPGDAAPKSETPRNLIHDVSSVSTFNERARPNSARSFKSSSFKSSGGSSAESDGDGDGKKGPHEVRGFSSTIWMPVGR